MNNWKLELSVTAFVLCVVDNSFFMAFFGVIMRCVFKDSMEATSLALGLLADLNDFSLHVFFPFVDKLNNNRSI